MPAPLGVLGAGSFGTALAVQLAASGWPTLLWVRREEAAEKLRARRRNDTYLPGVAFPQGLDITHDFGGFDDCDTVVVAGPSHGFRRVIGDFLAVRRSDAVTVVSATKGIEPISLRRMSEVTAEEAGRFGTRHRFAVFSGPTFAAELARGVPSAAVVAAAEAGLAEALCERLSSSSLRLYSATDVVGVELAGTAKNVIAIGAGLVAGLGLGHNTVAALITRGLHEMTRLGVAFGGDPATLYGLAGLGDLVLTCTGALSRNRQIGMDIAKGKRLTDLTSDTTMVAEGVRNSVAISRLARERDVEMPIIEQMVAVLYEGKPPRQAVHDLMTRELKHEASL